MNKFDELRKQMVDYQLAARGLSDQLVLDAVAAVPREEFIPTGLVEFAYRDSPLPIAASQTISQPYTVAFMLELLQPKLRQEEDLGCNLRHKRGFVRRPSTRQSGLRRRD